MKVLRNARYRAARAAKNWVGKSDGWILYVRWVGRSGGQVVQVGQVGLA